jgi:hypothetical protein
VPKRQDLHRVFVQEVVIEVVVNAEEMKTPYAFRAPNKTSTTGVL